MKWPLALSFSDQDLDIARSIASAFRKHSVGTYFYAGHLDDQAGELLYGLHEEIYSSAHVVAFLLRPDFLERPYTKLEYEVRRAHKGWPVSEIFVSMETGSDWLIPLAAPFGMRANEMAAVPRDAALIDYLRQSYKLLH